jgi:hypothetical protein
LTVLNARVLVLVGLTLAAAATRLLPHPPNFTAVEALALFGGACIVDRRAAFLFPLAAVCGSDLILGHFIYGYGWYYGGMEFVYLSFVLTTGVGLLLRPRRSSPWHTAAAAFCSSLLFFVVSNFGAWLHDPVYPRSFDGLVTCYVAAIPFFSYALAGMALYGVMLFGGYALAQRWLESREAAASNLAIHV